MKTRFVSLNIAPTDKQYEIFAGLKGNLALFNVGTT
jgi:hypothetical protein